MTFRRKLIPGLLIVAISLLAARLALPYVICSYVNARMEHMGDYRGKISTIDLHLWRGAYSIEGLKITKVSGKVPIPLLEIPQSEVSLNWRSLFQGIIRGKAEITGAILNFVDGGDKGASQTGQGVDWRQKLKLLVPIRLDELTVRDGTITFNNFVSSPQVNLKMTQVNGAVRNLTNMEQRSGSRTASLNVSAVVLGNAPLNAKATFRLLENEGDFNYELRIKHIQLKRINQLARAYAGLDFADGKGDFVMQLESKNGYLTGYAKPLFRNVKIFSWKQDVEKDGKNPIQLAWEAIAQGFITIFKNQSKDQFATRIPISGRIDAKRLGVLPAITGILRNAFIKAYTPELEQLRPRRPMDTNKT